MSPQEKEAEAKDLAILLQRMLNSLDVREARILKLRYGIGVDEPMTLEAIGKRFGLTRERVRQIEAMTIHWLQRRWLRQDWNMRPDYDGHFWVEPDVREDPALRRLSVVPTEELGIGPKEYDYTPEGGLVKSLYNRNRKGRKARSTSKNIRLAEAGLREALA